MASKGQRGGNRPCLRSPVLLLFASCLLVFTLLTISPVRHPVAQASWEVISRHGKALITPFTPHIEQQHDDLYRPHSAPDVPTTSSPSLPSTDYPLKSFLADRLEQPGTKRPEKLWLTVADGRYIDQVLSHLTTFLGKLNAHSSSHHHELLILCLDADCISSSAKRGWLAYGGYAEESWPDRGPQGMGKVQWVKTRGMGDVLQAGYAALFVDGDVFFRANPFEQGLFLPLSDKSWDVQVQDEGHKNQLNIGASALPSPCLPLRRRPGTLRCRLYAIIDGVGVERGGGSAAAARRVGPGARRCRFSEPVYADRRRTGPLQRRFGQRHPPPVTIWCNAHALRSAARSSRPHLAASTRLGLSLRLDVPARVGLAPYDLQRHRPA